MHGVQRSNGWNVLENKLVEWMEAVKAAEVPTAPTPASPNRKRKYSEITGLDSPRESYYSDSDFSTSPSHEQVYVQPTSYQTPATQSANSQYYQQTQTQLSQPQRSQHQQSYTNSFLPPSQFFWAQNQSVAMRSSFNNTTANPPAYSYYPQESAYYYDIVHQQPASHHHSSSSHWMPELSFQQPIAQGYYM